MTDDSLKSAGFRTKKTRKKSSRKKSVGKFIATPERASELRARMSEPHIEQPRAEHAYRGDGRSISFPSSRVSSDRPEYKLVPTRGSSHTLVVLSKAGYPLGWIGIDDVRGARGQHFDSVKEWMAAGEEARRS